MKHTLRGSSLIEVMVASAVLLVVMTSAASSIGFGVRHVGHSRRVAEAERIAASQMEVLLLEGRLQDPAPPEFISGRFGSGFRPQQLDEQSGQQRFTADGRADNDGDYLAVWSVTNGRPVPKGMRLRVDVKWQEGGGERSIGLTSYFAIPDFCDPIMRAKRERERDRDRRSSGRGGSEQDPCDEALTRGRGGFGGGD